MTGQVEVALPTGWRIIAAVDDAGPGARRGELDVGEAATSPDDVLAARLEALASTSVGETPGLTHAALVRDAGSGWVDAYLTIGCYRGGGLSPDQLVDVHADRERTHPGVRSRTISAVELSSADAVVVEDVVAVSDQGDESSLVHAVSATVFPPASETFVELSIHTVDFGLVEQVLEDLLSMADSIRLLDVTS